MPELLARAPVVPVALAHCAGKAGRILAIDWLRGLAVLVMIECHSLVLLQPRRVGSAFYLWLQGCNGLVAPTFIFAAGFSLSLVITRTGDSAIARRQRLRRSLHRVGQVFLVAQLLHLLTQPVLRHPILIVKVDILSCIAWGLLGIIGINSVIHKPWITRLILLGLTFTIFAICPVTELYRGNIILTGFINESNDSVFPLIPWLGYLFLGGFLGSLMAIPKTGKWWIWPMLLGMFIGGWILEYHLPVQNWYRPDANTWLLTNMGARIWRMTVVITALATLELISPALPLLTKNPLFRLFERFSSIALPAYCIHLTLLYGALGIGLPRIYHGRLDWGPYAVYTVGVIAVTGVLSRQLTRPRNSRPV